MKKTNGILGIVGAALVLAAGIVVMCVYMKQLRQLWNTFWDKLQERRADLKIYMD